MPCSGGPERHDQVDAGVERDRDQAQHDELRGNVAAGIDELRDEGEEERRCLRIERVGDDALAEGAPAAGRHHLSWLCDPGLTSRRDAQPEQIKVPAIFSAVSASVLAITSAAGGQPLAPPAGQRPRYDVEGAGARRQRDDEPRACEDDWEM